MMVLAELRVETTPQAPRPKVVGRHPHADRCGGRYEYVRGWNVCDPCVLVRCPRCGQVVYVIS